MSPPMPKLQASPAAPAMRQIPFELTNFAEWYFEGGIKLLPPQDGILIQQRPGTLAISHVLYRADPYQVELIIFGPGTTIPRHRHDHVDSIEVMLAGTLDLHVDAAQVVTQRSPRQGSGLSRDLLKFVPIPSDAYHHGQTTGGGSFLSVQRWKGMTPTHVGLEWQDEADQRFNEGSSTPWL